MKKHFVTVHTKNGDEPRNVTIDYADPLHPVLLGNLPHLTEIIIDQELVDNLSEIVERSLKHESEID